MLNQEPKYSKDNSSEQLGVEKVPTIWASEEYLPEDYPNSSDVPKEPV